MIERWRRSELIPNILVSDQGRAYLLKSGRYAAWRNRKGYVMAYSKTVHVLVMHAFIGPRPKGMETRHLNGIKQDNRLENLRYGTPAENTEDSFRLGVFPIGTRNGMSKLNPELVRQIRAEYRAWDKTASTRALAKKYGIAGPVLWNVVARKTWKHVT